MLGACRKEWDGLDWQGAERVHREDGNMNHAAGSVESTGNGGRG